jgi:phosphoglucomutase
MTRKIAEAYGAELRIVPVGFKFIGEQIKEMEANRKGSFLFGFEESIGYLKGTYCRDKDAVLAASLVAEAALYYKEKYGKDLYQVMQDLYAQYGYYQDRQESMQFDGVEGKQKIADILTALENDTRTEIAGIRIDERKVEPGLITINLENGGFIKARPSGTEPKIRFYFCICGNSMEEAASALEKAREELFEII